MKSSSAPHGSRDLQTHVRECQSATSVLCTVERPLLDKRSKCQLRIAYTTHLAPKVPGLQPEMMLLFRRIQQMPNQ